MNTDRKGITAWLTAEDTESPTQAAIQNLWMIWRRFASNPLGLFGLAIVAVLVVSAVVVPWVATLFAVRTESAVGSPGAGRHASLRHRRVGTRSS